MKAVAQTIFTAPGGNCFQACVASVLELDLYQVPHFFGDVTDPTSNWTQKHWEELRSFAASQGLCVSWIDPQREPDYARALESIGAHYVAFGDSPSFPGVGHCVVMKSGIIVHDPAMGCGLDSFPWLLIFFGRTAKDGDVRVHDPAMTRKVSSMRLW